MSKLEIKIDSTVLGRSGCILNLHNSCVEGYVVRALGASMVYGIAVHKFVDVMYQTGGMYPIAIKAALELFERLPKTLEFKSEWLCDPLHMRTTCHRLWTTYIEEEKNFEVLFLGNKPATEQTFNFIYYEDDDLIVRLCGTIDSIGQFKGGCFAIRDWKTTSFWDKKKYMKQYELSRQLRIYTLACKLMTQREPESTLGKIGATKMGAFIDAVLLKKEANEVEFVRSDVHQYSDEELSAFQLTLDDQCRKLSVAIKTGYIPKEGIVNGSCITPYGLCDFWNVCKSSKNVGEVLLARDFKKREFNPLEYNV